MVQPKIKIRGKEVPVPALSFDNMERLDQEETLGKIPLTARAYWRSEYREMAAKVLLTALRQEMAEGDVSLEDARKALTTQNIVDVVLRWCLAVSAETIVRAEAALEKALAEPTAEVAAGEAPRP